MSNLYKQFLDLLPPRSLQVATVLAVSDGTATVQLPGGGVFQARGAATVDQKVFVRDGLIEGVAPSLPVVTAEV